ncbi:MAG: hypothetical protein MMC33_005490 [Icmadophila ericetorum]|nr:hypothetical protein [Icmadophila ericetorum]
MATDCEDQDLQTEDAVMPVAQQNTQSVQVPDIDYSEWGAIEKKFIICMASSAAFFSPLSSNIYYPIFNVLAQDLHVSNTLINVTVTTYLIFQGLAPTVIGGISDGAGRRPSYIICFVIYLGANIGLALQNEYVALAILRCLQSAGSSSTVALANAVVADITTTAERGIYIGIASAGAFLGPSFGPIIGGLLSHYLGWRSIFWFLTIFAGIFFIPLLFAFPETCRKVVNDGSIYPPKWNMSLLTYVHQHRKGRTREGTHPSDEKGSTTTYPIKVPNPLRILAIIFEKEIGLVLTCTAIIFAAYFAISSSVPSQFGDIYDFNDIQIGLCFIPIGIGSLLAAFTQGKMVDLNYRRHAKRLNLPVVKSRQQDLTNFPIESARLEVAVPMLFIDAAATIAYGWVIHFETNLAGPLVLLFVISYTACAAFNVLSVLIVDIHPESPATATAANNLKR